MLFGWRRSADIILIIQYRALLSGCWRAQGGALKEGARHHGFLGFIAMCMEEALSLPALPEASTTLEWEQQAERGVLPVVLRVLDTNAPN